MSHMQNTLVVIGAMLVAVISGCSSSNMHGEGDEESNADEIITVELSAISSGFHQWTAHPEVGNGDHGTGGEDGEHN